MNKAILMGRLTRDPEMRQTQSGVSVVSFSIAITRGAPAIKIARVKPAGPGPTSTTGMFVISGTLRAMRPVKFKSNKKF